MELPTTRGVPLLQIAQIEALNLALLDPRAAGDDEIADLARVANQEGIDGVFGPVGVKVFRITYF